MRLLRALILLLTLLLVRPVVAQDATAEPIPDAVPLVNEGDQDIVNILLIGSGVENPDNPGLADSLMVVSVNRTAGAVSLLSIPRDLYVYVPGFGMNKINTAYFYGATRNVEGGGAGLMAATIRYNLGLVVDYYARVDFNGFSRIIDMVGGVTITVDCAIEDWRLKSPELDKQDPDNWEMFTLWSGVYHMDSDLALWYVRSRRTSSDLDRGRRQQDVIRALWRTIRDQGVLETLPNIWDDVMATVDTNLTLADVVGMSPLALSLDTADLSYYTFRMKHEVSNAYSTAGQQILVPDREAIAALMQAVVLPPNASQIRPERPTIGIVNASGILYLPYVVADRLELEGFRTVILDEWSAPREYNRIVDYTGATKGSPIGRLQTVLHVTEEGVAFEPDPLREYDFRVYIGNQEQFWACTRPVIQPPAPTATPDTSAEGG
ncbi:MAG: LCP family protein [Anaerolineaceae bacterium]|nr:LCP family protein [Anaerolineaceae bacterium]